MSTRENIRLIARAPFKYKANFKDFFYQTLCLFSQMKDTKHIRRDFNSVAWVMP